MPLDIKDLSESAKGYTKSPLGIIALFIVLIYGFATVVVTFSSNLHEYIEPMIYFLTIFPVVVFAGFLWLVCVHYEKIYGPSDFKNEDNFFRMKMFSVASLAAATIKSFDNPSNGLTSTEINSLVDSVNKIPSKKNKNTILWVDDRPENNVYERKAFEAMGIEISLALSTDEALDRLDKFKYSAIISDMGRKEGADEGYVLLKEIRDQGKNIPYYIYAGSNAPEHKKMAIEKGAQGSTNKAQELYEMVLRNFQ